ncbi:MULTISPECIES: hypothetical protein [Amycolatopsis]|uniref:Uncharacterized protein n=2 Tax=Amycolatopsis TaxID=1813 RepID=A0A2A9FDP0_9PSEU|nr:MULTISPECIES: hypothetical protein [Amycolatopsis]PFG48682.1 hypothetical protein ATK36_3784 [Amycolatopsis sulphurea]RJQ85794.1 hypothetical protein D5S19_12830 [Amycolatopsis panacis]
MPGLAEIHQLLTAALAGLGDGRAHAEQARALLVDARRALVDAQAKADPWLPVQLAQADEGLDHVLTRLAAADDLVGGYRSRL